MIKIIDGQSVTLLKNNQSDFNERNLACSQDNETFCQFVNKKTFTQFQVKLTPTTGNELLDNSNFANNISDWIPSGTMTASHSTLYGGSARLNGTGPFQQVLTTITIVKYYNIEAVIRDFERISDGFISAAGLNVNTTFIPTNAGFSYLPSQTVNIRDKKVQIWFTATNTTHIISLVAINANVLFEYCKMVELTIPVSKVTTFEKFVCNSVGSGISLSTRTPKISSKSFVSSRKRHVPD
jgi:hypothetical protein